jgi:hypothetical protein
MNDNYQQVAINEMSYLNAWLSKRNENNQHQQF